MKWQNLRSVNLERLHISPKFGEPWLYDFNFDSSQYDDSNWPDQFKWVIDERLFDSKITTELQQTLVNWVAKVFTETKGCTGFIMYDNCPWHSSTNSPYEILRRTSPSLNMPYYDKRTRGYYWGNFLTQAHLDQIGGLESLRQLPIYRIDQLGNGYYVQLTENIEYIPRSLLVDVAQLFAPILPQASERMPPLEPNPYLHILDVPYDGPSQAELEQEWVAKHKAEALPTRFPGQSGNYENEEEPEAREWLANNGNASLLAGNRFAGREAAQQFVETLYDIGAEGVYVSMIYNETWRIEKEGGPYATSLIVKLPKDKKVRQKIFAIAEEEARAEGFLDDNESIEDRGEDEITFWWD